VVDAFYDILYRHSEGELDGWFFPVLQVLVGENLDIHA
jgi:hypothetical protein